jgi:hypothetical protein
VAFGLPDQIARQATTALIGLPPLAKAADLRFRRRPELRARVGSRDACHEVNRPLVIEKVKRADVQDHGTDQAAAVTDDALEQRPYIHDAAVGLALLAAQRVDRLAPDLGVLVVQRTGQRGDGLRCQAGFVEQQGRCATDPPALVAQPLDRRCPPLGLWCCPALKIPMWAVFTTPMKNRAIRAV